MSILIDIQTVSFVEKNNTNKYIIGVEKLYVRLLSINYKTFWRTIYEKL